MEPGQTEFRDSRLRTPDLAQGGGIEILCACDARYLPHMATMLCSLLENNRVSRIHLLYSFIKRREIDLLKKFVEKYGSVLQCYEMRSADFQDLLIDKWASAAVYYRLLAPRILPVDINKILYLDCDLIVRRSLNDLWKTDLFDQAVAAVSDYDEDGPQRLGLPEGCKYFNSGVLLINLDFWRRNNVSGRCLDFIRNNPEKIVYWDQDALNAILVGRWIAFDARWNCQKYFEDDIYDPHTAIVHFCGEHRFKPWHWSLQSPFKQEYHKYRLKTPWRRYKLEGRPRLHHLRGFARAVLPSRLRKWLRSQIMTSHITV